MFGRDLIVLDQFRFNSNIRCIEMQLEQNSAVGTVGFNSNIRCIEMRVYPHHSNLYPLFNSNIRCIEISRYNDRSTSIAWV